MTTAIKNWERRSLEQLSTSIDYGHTASADASHVGPRFLRITDIQNGVVNWETVPYCAATESELDRYRLASGDIVFARTGNTTGKSFLIRNCPDAAVFASYLIRVRPNHFVESRYLSHFFATTDYWNQVAKNSEGAGQPGVNASKLKQLSVPVPHPDDPTRSLAEQKRIANILDKADAIRRKRHEAITLSDNLLPSMFTDMFGPAGNRYRTEPLERHLEFLTSGSRGWAEHYVKSGKRFIRSLDVQMNRIGTDEIVFVNPPPGTEADRTRVQDGDVLITITGSRIGRVAFIPDSFGEAYVSQHVAIARLKQTLRPRYCSLYLSLSDGGQRQIAKAQYGQTKPGLSLTNIREFQIPIPPTTEQDHFLQIWDRHELMATRHECSTCNADELFISLVQRAFRGEL